MPRLLAFALSSALLVSAPVALLAQSPETLREQVSVNTATQGTPFPHFWENMFGSGRAVLSLRADWRKDAATVQAATGFRYVRFHGIFDHDVGVYDGDKDGKPVYDWSYVDQIYDGLLAQGVKPYVELSFMPEKMASEDVHQAFWYHPNPSPPASYAQWDAMITAFAQHLVARYGIDEVAQWYFEVWNEPNLDFWVGKPAQSTYFTLYDNTAKALKAVNTRIRVGGPATAQAAWIPAMIEHAQQDHIPLDFVSTHVYGNDTAKDVFPPGTPFAPKTPVPPHQMVAYAVQAVHQQILHSSMPHIPLIWSEFNAAYDNEQAITDSIYMGPWIADTIRQCDGNVQQMSYWTFSDVFEEQGVIKTPFYGGFGLIAERGIPKPAFMAFSLLHTLGSVRIPVKANDVLVTRRADGTLVIAAWDFAEPPGSTVPDKTITLDLNGIRHGATATVRRVDAEHGDTLDAWKQMGSPAYPTLDQIASLKKIGTLGEREPLPITGDTLKIHIPSSGLAVIEVRP